MSVFTNAMSGAGEHAEDYISAVLGLVGQRDPLEVLRTSVDRCVQIIQPMTAEQRATPEAPGKWSAGQVIQHLADGDLVWGYRFRCILAGDRPRISGYDQDRWADQLRYTEVPIDEGLELLRVLRRSNLRILEALTPDELQRVGVHEERGEESVQHMIRLHAGHDMVHLNQLERIRKAVA